VVRAAVVMAFPFGDGRRGTNGGRRTVSTVHLADRPGPRERGGRRSLTKSTPTSSHAKPALAGHWPWLLARGQA
jgi:hypothetical protein